MIDYTDELRRHHLKATPQRLAISNALHSCGHINIDTLYSIMLKKFNSISLATIYKNINLMLENSYIQEVKIPQNKSVYELTKTIHSHLVCQKCGKVEDISLHMDSILNEALSKSNFEISKTDLVLSGVCKNCQ
ncbi:Fur family transcriptional regulator [Sulfurimonas sp.]|uniref:Fur family transcriptional regulator n=1 Tax=Sulfurimonas sp. TaxID=2022749 RepID=UPI003561E60B